MHSSVGVSKIRQEQSEVAPSVDLRIIKPLERQRPLGGFWRMIIAGEVIADLVTITSSIALSYSAYYALSLGKHLHYRTQSVWGVGLGFSIVMVLMFDRAGAYARGNSLLRVRETEQVLRVSSQAFLIALAISFSSGLLFSRWLLVLCFTLVPLALFAQKTCMYMLVNTLHAKGYGKERVLIYGAGHTGRRVYSVLRRSPKLGLEPVAFVDDCPEKVGCAVLELGYENRGSASVMRGPMTRHLVSECAADVVVIAIPSIQHEKFHMVVEEVLAANARVSFVPSTFVHSGPLVDFQDIDGVLLASFSRGSRRFTYEWAKRIFDLSSAAALLLLSSPLFLLLAILIKLDSEGPVLFQQERVGLNGLRFRMFKFRTMHRQAPAYAYSPKEVGDPRITRLGRWLRRTSLDEVPQLLNVLAGDMSLVGPRPEMPFIVERYGERDFQRMQVKPGITGLWQLSGDRKFLIHENIEYDLYYIKYRSFFMDLAILLHTVIFAMRGI